MRNHLHASSSLSFSFFLSIFLLLIFLSSSDDDDDCTQAKQIAILRQSEVSTLATQQ